MVANTPPSTLRSTWYCTVSPSGEASWRRCTGCQASTVLPSPALTLNPSGAMGGVFQRKETTLESSDSLHQPVRLRTLKK